MIFSATKFDETLDFLCESLGMNKEEAINLLLDNAAAFMEQWLGKEHQQEISMWLELPSFWVWWRQVWYQADMNYIGQCSKLDFYQWRKRGMGSEIYSRWHRIDRIKMHPPSAIVSDLNRKVKETRTALAI